MKKLLLLPLLLLALSVAHAQKTKMVIRTQYGDIKVVLYDGTPQHRDNMVKLVKQKFYDSLLWHRVIPQFVIQGGDPDSKRAAAGKTLGEGDVGYRVPAEIKPEYFHKRGALGMARDNNPNKASSGCQFYIVAGKPYTDAEIDQAEKRSGHKVDSAQRVVYRTMGGTPFLDGNYTVFGEVTEGMDVVDKIAALPRDKADRPTVDVRILSIRIKRKKFLGIF